jgi:stage II sporulation protein D
MADGTPQHQERRAVHVPSGGSPIAVARRVRWAVGSLLIGACIAGIGVGSAAAQPITFTFYGRGNGHGIGMSQWGAEGAAQQGWSASRILTWYYRGSSITTVPTTNVRVSLAGYAAQFGIGVQGAGQLVDAATGVRTTLSSGAGYVVRPSGAGLVVINSGGTVIDRASNGVRVVPEGSGLVEFNGNPYRGSLTVTASGGTINAVNVVPMESYLRGVVPSEMPSSWAPAALQAQAIAARSYALRSINLSAPFDVYPDTRSQVYGGVYAEAASSNAAIGATVNQAVTYHGQVVQAFFASSDGGYTESVQNVWGGTVVPYLVGVPDPFDAIAPSHLWRNPPQFTGAQLGNLLGTGGTVARIDVLKRGVSPRVMVARVTLASGATVQMTGSDIEAYLGLWSTWFWVGQSNQPMPKEPPIGGSPPPPVAPTARHTPPGSYLVVVGETSNAALARRMYKQIAHIAPGEQLITRRTRTRRIYLVVAIRVATRSAATQAQVALKRFKYRSIIVRAVAGDPPPRPGLTQTIAAHSIAAPSSHPPAPAPSPATPSSPAPGGLVSGSSSGPSAGVAPPPGP